MQRMRILLVVAFLAGVAGVVLGVVLIAQARAITGWAAYTPLVTLRFHAQPSTPWPSIALLLGGLLLALAAAAALVLVRRGRWGLPR